MQAQQCHEANSEPSMQALAVVLKQHGLLDLSTLLALLSCSKPAASPMHAECKGRLYVFMPCKLQEADQQPGRHTGSYRLWLPKHASLLRALSLNLNGAADEAAVAAGLNAAAAAVSATADLAPAGKAAEAAAAQLPLKSLHCWSPSSGELLAAVARSSSPTSLLLTLEGGGSMAERPALSAPFASLTSLQQLELLAAGAAPSYVSQLGGALTHLPGLRELRLGSYVLLQPADVRALPVSSLRVLSLSSRTHKDGRLGVVKVDCPADECPEPRQWVGQVRNLQVLDLTPLSSLIRLDMPSLTPWDKLPPSLQELRLTTPFHFGPLLRCTFLQTLTVQDKQGVTPWEELHEVSAALPALQSVAVELGNRWGVGYYGGEELPWATHGLHHTGNELAGIKQLKQLVVKDFYLLPSFIKGLGRYSQLTHLALRDCALIQHKNDDLHWDCLQWNTAELTAHIHAFVVELKKLDKLQHLEMEFDLEGGGEYVDTAGQAAWWDPTEDDLRPILQPLATAASQLPSVQRLYLNLALAVRGRGRPPGLPVIVVGDKPSRPEAD